MNVKKKKKETTDWILLRQTAWHLNSKLGKIFHPWLNEYWLNESKDL